MIWEFAYNLFEWINVRSSKPKTDEGWRAQETKKNIRFLFCVHTNIHQSRLNHFASPFDRVASECVVPKKKRNNCNICIFIVLCCIDVLCCAKFCAGVFFSISLQFFPLLFVCLCFFLAVRNTKSPSFIIPLKSNINGGTHLNVIQIHRLLFLYIEQSRELHLTRTSARSDVHTA